MWGDIELAWRVRDKVTARRVDPRHRARTARPTTAARGHDFLAANGLRAAPCGNIGVPVLDAVRDPGGFDVLVVELSSYQIHHLPSRGSGPLHPVGERRASTSPTTTSTGTARPRPTATRRPTCTRTRRSRASTTAPTRPPCAWWRTPRSKRAPRHRLRPRRAGSERLRRRRRDPLRPRVPRGAAHGGARDHDARRARAAGLAAPHVVANILAAAALARSYGVPVGVIHDALGGVPPRRAPHRDRGRRRRHPLDRRLEGHEPARRRGIAPRVRAVVWIVGGLLKGVDADALVAAHAARLRAAIVIGVDRAALVAAFRRHAPELPVFEVVTR